MTYSTKSSKKKDYIFPEELELFPSEIANIINSFRICHKPYKRTIFDQSDNMKRYIFDIKIFIKYGNLNNERSKSVYYQLAQEISPEINNFYCINLLNKIRRNTEYSVMRTINIKNECILKELEDKGLNDWLEKRQMSLYNKHK